MASRLHGGRGDEREICQELLVEVGLKTVRKDSLCLEGCTTSSTTGPQYYLGFLGATVILKQNSCFPDSSM
ncbi:hypothetical protein Y1Q_0021655 [Alligator mississippiensis]|uniref:Uncharacterized protein n=1 Tax=Alligator mississippiensis TaxID=8496 RepID=A0A151PAK9_ALLMI|nr:hypothetical protein Y1Q_0021655 [Alligator mississippiensis]